MRIGISIALVIVVTQLASPVSAQLAYAPPQTEQRYPGYPATENYSVSSQTPVQPVAVPQASTLPPSTDSQDIGYSELLQRLATLEAKAATQPTGVQQASFLTPQPASAVHCGSFCSDPELTVNNWFAGVDLTVFQPSFSSSAFTIDDDTAGVGPRLFIGRESYRGFGWRTRFWWIDVDSESLLDSAPPTPFILNLQASRFDVDFYRRFSSQNGSLLFGSGITGAGLRFKFDEVLAITEEGGGVSVFAEGRHRLYDSDTVEWAVFSRGRWSYLVGEWEDASPTSLPRGDSNLNIAEAELALEFTRKFDTLNFVARYGIEAQAWDTTYFERTSFLGSTIRLALEW